MNQRPQILSQQLPMKIKLALIIAALVAGFFSTVTDATAQSYTHGFSEPGVLFYGGVRKTGGGQTALLQSGKLRMTFVNQSNSANVVALEADLRPTGNGPVKPFSYALTVPLAYLPDASHIGETLAVSTLPTNFIIQQITVDGIPATLPDGSKEFYSLSSASRSSEYRLDLIVAGNSTDSDRDGLPDWWENLYGLNSNLADATTDLDNDGWSNLIEFQRGSNPAISNRNPMLATGEVLIPESGEAGFYPIVLDSDSANSEIQITLSAPSGSGIIIKVDGQPTSTNGTQQFPLTDLHAGRVTIAHADRSIQSFALPIRWSDGGESDYSGDVLVRVISPSFSDGSDASLWLDGHDLARNGSSISSWNDRSGNARHAMQPLASYQPKVANHSADFSSGTSAHLFFQDAAFPAGDQTVLATYAASATSDAPQTLLSTNRGYLHLAPTTQAISYPGAPTWQVDGTAIHGYENATGTTTTSIFRRQASLLQNIFGLSYDGQTTAATAIDPVIPTLGARRSAIPEPGANPVDQTFAGQLHELLVFPSALPEQKLRGVNDYLQSKWGGAVIWNFSTNLTKITLTAGPGSQNRIIRGGFGNDQLTGGDGKDTISGGGGDDILTGGTNNDRFVFGGVDTGRDAITDFDPLNDIIDLSAPFWGMTGDARAYIAVRLDTNYATPVPTLDSVLVVTRPDGSKQEIVLRKLVLGSTQLIRLIAEGNIRMGGLSIPTTVQLTMAPGSTGAPISESLDESFALTVTRSGAGTSAALDVPIGFFEQALSGRFLIEGATSNQGKRSVVSFARGQTSKTLTVRPIPDLESTGTSNIEVAVLPHFRYAVAGAGVSQTIGDNPMVWLEVIQESAVANPAQPAAVRIHRSGSTSQNLTVDLQLGGTAENGVHIQTVSNTLTIPAGQSSRDLTISARAAGLAAGPKVALIRLASREQYLLGNPHEALVFVGNTAAETDDAGFDRWLHASTHGVISRHADLQKLAPGKMSNYVLAYAFGLASVDDLGKHGITLNMVAGRPELKAPGQFKAADLRWSVQSTATLGDWENANGNFTRVPDPAGLKLVGQPLSAADKGRFYRLNLTLDPGQLVGDTITATTGSPDYGMTGNWNADPATGQLTSSSGNAGETNRIIANITGPVDVDFEMEIIGGNGSDSLVLYIDGVRQTTTEGQSVRHQQALTGTASHLFMWEFTRGSGKAVIRNLAQ